MRGPQGQIKYLNSITTWFTCAWLCLINLNHKGSIPTPNHVACMIPRKYTGETGYWVRLTSPPLFDFLCSLGRPSRPLLLLLLGSTPVEVLYHHSHEHVQNKKTHQQEKRNEVDQPPFVEVFTGLE